MNHLSMELQVHPLVLQDLEESERNLRQSVNLGMLSLTDFSRFFILFFKLEYSNRDDDIDKRQKRAAPSGLLAGWKQSLAKKQAKTINGE